MISIINPWHDKNNTYSRSFFEYPDNSIFEYRGVKVYKSYSGSFDYVLGDTAITQRAGFTKSKAPEIIDLMLDGGSPVSDKVAAHIKVSGFNPLSYCQYIKLFNGGKMK